MALRPKYALSICAGVGAFDLGLEIAFPESVTVCYVEREIAAVEVLVVRMEEGSLSPAPVFSSLLEFDGKPWRGIIHTVIAGLPCQPYSIAGKQLGHNDERAIWPAFIRVVGEVQPEVVFFENVPAFLGYFRPIGNELQGMGYIVEEPLLVTASECGASHKRERFFAMAHRQSGGFGKLRQSSRGDGFINGSNAGLVDTERPGPPPAGSTLGSGTATDKSVGPSQLADASRDEWSGPHGEAGSRRRVCETGNELGYSDSARWSPGSGPTLDAESESESAMRSMANTGDGLVSQSGRRSKRRDGAGPASQVLGCRAGRDIDVADTERCGPQREHKSGGTGSRGTQSPRDISELADTIGSERRPNDEYDKHAGGRFETSDRSGSTGSELGHADIEGLEGRDERGHSSGERAVGPAVDELANADCEDSGREPDAPQRERWKGRRTITGRDGTGLPLFAPGPGATDEWQRVLRDHPWLAPALSEEEIVGILCRVAPGTAGGLDFEDRTDRLRSLGNLACPIQVAFALTMLARRLNA